MSKWPALVPRVIEKKWIIAHTFSLIPKRDKWTCFSFLDWHLWSVPEERLAFMLGRTSNRNRNFHLWGTAGSPAGSFQGSQLKVVCLWPLLLQEVPISWRMVSAFHWLLRLDCWLGTLKFNLPHPVEGDSWWGPSGSLAEKSFPVSEMNFSIS